VAPPRWLPFEVAERRFERLNLEHPEVAERVVREIESGVEVYYDRPWPLTERFCRFLLERPELVAGRHAFVAGAGVGMESVVVAHLARRVTINDVAPVALELCREQLERNGIETIDLAPGPFEEAELEGVDRVVACFVVYDETTEGAMKRLLRRTARRRIPVLLANETIGPHFEAVLESAERPVRDLTPGGGRRFVRVGADEPEM